MADVIEGDRVEVVPTQRGLLFVKKLKTLKEIQKRMAGRLPQWPELEGEADKIVDAETASR